MIRKRLLRWALGVLAALGLLLLLGAGWAWHLHRRALPERHERVSVTGLTAPVEVLWDEWGVPHIFASNEADLAFGLGWAVARDRLFQLVLLKHISQGRIAELFGHNAVATDRLFRTMDFHGQGKRMSALASAPVRRGVEAYTAGINAYAAQLGGRLPIEFALLRLDWEPLAADDLAGLTGLMVWPLHDAWRLDPLYRKLEAKLGTERAASLFPDALAFARQPRSAHAPAAPAPPLPEPDLMLAAAQGPLRELLLPPLAGSNSWVVAPSRSATGHALLASDPHLALALPSIWYEAHLVAPGLDVAGVTIPGMPAVIIGHNRRIAWGMTVLMTDAGNFFLERLDPGPPLRVMSNGRWVPVTERKETIRVRGGPAEQLVVLSTPHGPLVSDLLNGETDALSYRWAPTAAQDSNDIEAFYRMAHAGSWPEFRGALSLLGAVSMNVTYADRDGHIGLQTVGRVPVRKGYPAGLRIRKGWDGSEDWAGFVPFERMPNAYDPPAGWLATSNNQPFDRPTPFYLASRYEPRDRFLRVKERLSADTRWTPEGFGALQSDVQWVTARAWAPRVAPACGTDAGTHKAPLTELERGALALLNGWDGTMSEDSGAAAVFAETYRQLFRETFADKLDPALLTAIEDIPNLHAQFLRIAFEEDPSWFDRAATPERETSNTILCTAFRKAAGILAAELGNRPETWRWGAHHTLTLNHALSRSRVLAPYFSRGPYPRLGHNQTVNKQQTSGIENEVRVGASTRQVVDLGDPAHALAVIPGGQSGIPASTHYNDQTPLWLSGRFHPMLMERADIERHLEERVQLIPAPADGNSPGSNPPVGPSGTARP